MINRFKNFLEKEFRVIAPTQQAMDYREEILGTLLDRAQEYRIKGMEDDEMIYNLCIDSLGNFKATLVNFEQAREQIKKKAAKAGVIALSVLGAVVLLTIGYLAASFITSAWNKTWLIEVCGLFLFAIVGMVIPMPTLIQKKNNALLKLIVSGIVTLIFTAIFLILLIMTNITQTWLLFIALPIAILGAIVVLSAFTGSKAIIGEAIAFIQTSSALIYVILALRDIIPWSPYWLMPVGGAFISICIVVTALALHNKNKAVQKKVMTEEDYYTSWRQ
ncbi:MAG: hypothetical protein EOM87_05465 [Clostridia bacterium]|nr:hypothetical protein [Clostridia bacterium]